MILWLIYEVAEDFLLSPCRDESSPIRNTWGNYQYLKTVRRIICLCCCWSSMMMNLKRVTTADLRWDEFWCCENGERGVLWVMWDFVMCNSWSHRIHTRNLCCTGVMRVFPRSCQLRGCCLAMASQIFRGTSEVTCISIMSCQVFLSVLVFTWGTPEFVDVFFLAQQSIVYSRLESRRFLHKSLKNEVKKFHFLTCQMMAVHTRNIL